MENRNSLQPIRTAAPADRLLGRVCSVGGRRYLDCGFDQLIAVSDADAARYADGAFVEVEIAAGATPWRDAVSQQQAVQQSFDQLIASIREHTTLEVGLAAADVERLQSELTAHALSGRRFRVYAPGNSCHFTLNPKNCTGEHLFRLLAGERIEAQCWDYTDFNRLKTNVDEPVCLNPVRPAPVEAAEGECFDVYVNRAVDFGLFVSFGGNDGLIHKKSLPNYDERFRSGEIAAAYRRGMKIRAKLLSKTRDEQSGRLRYTFDPVTDDAPVAFDSLTLDVGDTVTVHVNNVTRNGLSVRYRGEVHTVDRNSIPNCVERFRNGIYLPNQPLRVKMIRRNDKQRHFLFELLDKTVDYGLTEGDILRCEITPTEIPATTEIRTTIDQRSCSFHLHPQELPYSLNNYLREHSLETEVRVCGFFEHGDPKFQFKSLIADRILALDEGLTLDAEVLFEDGQAGIILWRAGEVFGFLPVGSYSFPMARNIAFSPGERIAVRVGRSDGKTFFRLAQPPVNPWDSLSGIAEGKRIRVQVCDVREDEIRIGYDRVFGILKPYTARRPEAGETVEAFVSRFSPSEAVLECFTTDCDTVPDSLEPGTEYDLQVVAHAAGAGKLWALQQERLIEIELERPEMPDYVTECLLRHGSRVRVRAEERDGVRRVRLLYDRESLWAQAGLREGDRCYPVIAEIRPDRMIVTHRDVIGYIPNDELDWNSSRIVDRSAYRPGMQVEALVLRADAASGELVFSRKELLEDPWPAYPHREGDTTEGTVAAVLPNGNLLVNADGIVGEVLKYNVSWFNFQSGMNRYRTGDRLRVLLVKFDPEARVLFLSGTGGAESPWNGVNYRVGSKYEVTVLRTDRMAVMVALDGIIGEIPRERIGWITPPSAEGAFAEGERIEAQLIFINRTKRVAQFSRKAVLPDPWSVPIAEGDVAEAKVVEATASEVRFDVGGRLGVCSRETARTFVAGACGDVQPDALFHPGELRRVRIEGIDRRNQRLYVGSPDREDCRRMVGQRFDITVLGRERAGYRVETAGGIRGMLSFERATWSAPETSRLAPGERLEAQAAAYDFKRGCLLFDHRTLIPDPWKSLRIAPESFIETQLVAFDAGSAIVRYEGIDLRQYGTVECTVVSVGDDRTLTVDAAGYAGVVPCGELAWGEPSATFVPGQRLSAVILQIDYEDLSLALSLRYAEGIPPADMPLRIGEAHRVRITDVRTAARKMPEQLTVESVEMPALRGVIFARDLAWERAGRSAAAYRPGEEIEAVVTDLMPRKLTFKASLRDMVDDTRSLDDIRPGEKLDVTLRKFIPQEFAAEVTYYDYAGRLTLDAAVWSGVENLANFFRPGREIEAEVTAVDPDTRSLAFRLPEDEYTPDWEGVRLTEGDTLEVTADYVMDSALFVNYHGIVVTLRREELSWLPVFRIGENYRDGDTLRVKVKRFDRESRILKFSVRELLPNPFLQEMPFAEGDLVRGSVMQVVPQGIYVDCSGYPCYIANTEFAGEIHRNYKAGDALRARILSIDPVQRKIRLTRRCEELSGEELRFSPGEWLWFTVTERTATGLWAEYEGYRAFLSDTDAGFRENESPSQRYGPGQLVRMRVTGIDEKANALTVSAELVSDYSQFDSCTVGTVDVAEVIHVAVKAITVCFRGIYCRVPLERASLFPIANAKMLYAVREQLTMVVEAADPETRTLKLSVQQRYNDWSEIPVRPGDRVSGEICFRSPRFGLLLRDGDLFYRVCAESRFWQPATELALYPIGSRCEEAVVERIDPDARMIYVSIGTRTATDPFEQARLRNGDIVKATVAGGDKTVCVLRCGELYLSMPREEVLPGHAPECGDEVKVRILSVDKVKRTFYVSQRAVTHDPLLTFSVGQKAEGTVQSLFGTMCLVRVNGLVGTLPVSEAQIKAMNIRSDANITVYVSAIRFTKRQITFSLTPTTNNDLAVGSRVQCTVVKATAHHVFCTFPKRGRLYDAAIRSSEFYWNRPTDVPCQPGDRINAVITGEEIIGKTKYTTLNACALTPNPLLTCETGDTLPCTVLGTTAGGYLMRCGGAVGFLHCSEIMWQYCDQWHGVWKRGEKVSCRILHLSPAEGGLLLGHRQTVGDPFLKHTPGVGSGYPATVRRSSDESVVVLLGDTGIEATISKADMKLFFTGVGQFIPQPGTTISEVTVVRIENPGDPKRRHPFVRVTLL